jgi:phenylalanyl-tRNA synthetase beta chain
MNISLNWLTDYVDVDLPAGELGELFTRIGLNCEGIEEIGDDIALDLEVTSNRSDCLGHIGVARELAAATGKQLKLPKIKLPAGGTDVSELTSVEVLDADICPRYTARVIRNVKVGPSPQWLVDYLRAIGMRSVNNIVDITNFVLMEYSQPLHAFDQDKLAGGCIVVRRAKPGETLVSIDETTCNLTDRMLVIADAEKPVAVAGVMGGLGAEVGDATTNVLIESAQFDPLVTRYTSRALGLMSESNFRFERGVDPVGVDAASQRACAMICELAGGELAEGAIDIWAKPYEAPVVTLRPERTNKLLGIDTPTDRQVEILAALGLEPTVDGDGGEKKIVCTIPPYRAEDLTREADLIEEVARLVEYDNIPTKNSVTHRVRSMGQTERLRRKLIASLTAAGYDEAITVSFIDPADAAQFGCDRPVCVDANVRKSNNALRPSLMPSLMRAAKTNQDLGNNNLSLFELAAVFPPAAEAGQTLPDEFVELALITTADLRDLRGAVEAVVEQIDPESQIEVRPKAQPGLAEGVSAEITLDGQPVGVIGRIGPQVQDYFDLEKPIAAATLRFDALAERANLTRTARPLSKFPPVRRDLSLILDESVTWGELAEAFSRVAQPLRTGQRYVTTYRGKPIPKDKKSVTVSLEYRSDETTLTSEQVDGLVAELFETLKKTFDVKLRA